ncbi:MAG: hypothetical protein JWP63_3759 [Candidatus Solibacter sp.]|nr:hypothetical protein [Candidatus Solibacter sp.]
MRIVVVGGGCSGLLVAFQLLQKGFSGPLTLVEPRAELGQGIAYSTRFDGHLLNVAAEKMSALPSEPSHFLDWLRARGVAGAAPGMYAPRRLYGEYLAELLRGEHAKFRHVRAEVVKIASTSSSTSSSARLTLDDGTSIDAERVVLALGNPTTGSRAEGAPAGLEEHWHGSPWVGNALRLRTPGERILLLGAGQTAVDAVLTLQSQPGGCHVHMLSRSGRLSQVHSTDFTPAPPHTISAQRGIRAIVRELRAQVRSAREQGIPWQAVVDSLRPVSNEMWHGLPLADRRRFMRHLKTYWETHRSRMPPSVGEQLDKYRAAACVEIIAGRLRKCALTESGVAVRVALRGGGERLIEVDRVIDCTGIHEYYHVRARPLIAGLLRDGLASANDLGIGFHADENGALIGPASGVLFTLGPPRRGDLFETIAVPEIRAQAEALAAYLMASAK